MKLEISYGSGISHQLELAAEVAVLGRDPHCDVVLNDTRCSRRHATLENGPGGVVVKDAGSANGIYVNGRRVESAPLGPGDTLRLGDVSVRVIPELGETVVAAPDDFDLRALALESEPPAPPPPAYSPPAALTPAEASAPTPLASPPPPRTAERPLRRRSLSAGPPRPAPEKHGRPLTVTLLAALWALGAPALATALLLVAHRLEAGPLGWTIAVAFALGSAGLGGSMVYGLLTCAPWARHLQIAAAAVALLFCPATPAAATVLLYLTRDDVKRSFDRTGGARAAGEPAFALTLAATLLLGAAASAALLLFFRGGGRG